jgi:phosphatidylglycerol:prolipoprotein diacylglycerol transferase
MYLIFYGIFRFVVEFFRADPRGSVFFLSVSQFISIILIGAGMVLWIKQAKKII